MAAETRGHEWDTRWHSNRNMRVLIATCVHCGAVEQIHENGTCWMSKDIDPDQPCPGKPEAME